MSQTAVINAVGLTKVFRDFWQRARVTAVRDLDFAVEPGEIHGLLGPNGSGKSTSIKMILGLLRPTRGRISVFGQAPDHVQTKRRIGYLPEESFLYRFLNARETLDYYGTLFHLPRSERRRRTEELLEMVGLKSAARRPVGEYSKGMARRIGLAQALINDPDLLILDEPTSGLDPIGANLVKDVIVRLGQVHKKTILLSSHLLADVEEVCSRVTILYGGRMQVSGTIDEVLKRDDMVEMTTERLSPETMAAVEALVKEREGKSLDVRIPHDRLEALFMRIVREAHAQRIETSGAGAGGEIAGFLGDESQAGEAVIESLVAAGEQPAAEQAAADKPSTDAPAVDRSVLESLSGDAERATDSAETSETVRGPEPEVDRNVLADLTGGDQAAGDEQKDKRSSDS